MAGCSEGSVCCDISETMKPCHTALSPCFSFSWLVSETEVFPNFPAASPDHQDTKTACIVNEQETVNRCYLTSAEMSDSSGCFNMVKP